MKYLLLIFSILALLTACSDSPQKGKAPIDISTDMGANNVTPIECGPGQIDCDGACVITDLDDENCGGCGVSCTAMQVCSNGSCAAVPSDCRNSELPCPARYYCDETTGFCEVGCSSNDECPGGTFCELDSRSCRCADEGQVLCGTECVPESAQACGFDCQTCQAPAGGDASCNAGVCESDCPEGTELCGGTCAECPSGAGVVSTTCDGNQCVASECAEGFENCDGTCSACPEVGPGVALGCEGTQCVVTDCSPGTRLCGDECASCPQTSTGDYACSGDQCVVTCPGNLNLCSNECAAPDDATACGSSCTQCPSDPNGTPICQNGSCSFDCASGYRECGGSCASCPTLGVATTSCSGATCVAATCQSGYTACPNGCCRPPMPGVVVQGSLPDAVDIALDSLGFPHVAFSDSNGLTYAFWDGSAWQTDILPGGASDVAMDLDDNDQAHFAFYDSSPSTSIFYTTYSGAFASKTPVASADAQSTPDIAVDGQGVAHIVYSSPQGAFVHAQSNNGWTPTTIDSDPTGIGPALVIQGSTLHAVYFDDSVSAVYHRTRTLPNGSWSPNNQTNNVNGSESAEGPVSFALGANGEGAAAWVFGNIKAATYNGNFFGGRTGVSQEFGDFPEVAIDAVGTPHIVFEENSGGITGYFEGTFSWTRYTVNSSGTLPDHEFDGAGKQHIVYFNTSDNLYYDFR